MLCKTSYELLQERNIFILAIQVPGWLDNCHHRAAMHWKHGANCVAYTHAGNRGPYSSCFL